jgi:hypothetical protein
MFKQYEEECQHDMGYFKGNREYCLMTDHYRILGTDEADPKNWKPINNKRTTRITSNKEKK